VSILLSDIEEDKALSSSKETASQNFQYSTGIARRHKLASKIYPGSSWRQACPVSLEVRFQRKKAVQGMIFESPSVKPGNCWRSAWQSLSIDYRAKRIVV
jgi:hypothetical protein